jgi:RimJ/RimL family protein N-acetyltransferase
MRYLKVNNEWGDHERWAITIEKWMSSFEKPPLINKRGIIMKYDIIPIIENHIEGYAVALDSVARERKYLGFLEGPSLESSRAFVLKNISENRPHFIALDKNIVIGWCDITSLSRPIYSHAGELGMGVLANYRGRGIGLDLIQAALVKAKSVGLTRIELIVREDNTAAIALYQKIGFAIEGLHKNAIKIDDDYINTISMALLY